MSLLLMCIKIFFARILDVTISTTRTIILVKGKNVLATILSFIEVMIWFVVAREALITTEKSLWIAISYAAGFATGTLIGTWVSKTFIKSIIGVQVITTQNPTKMIEEIKICGFGVSEIDLKKEPHGKKKHLLYIQINSKSLKKLKTIIDRYDPAAFTIVSDTKLVHNGYIK